MLEKLITSGTRRHLLVLFLTNPDARFYLRELSRNIKKHPTLVAKELAGLVSIGFLKVERVANLSYYTVNKDFLLFNELNSIVHKTDQSLALASLIKSTALKSYGKNLATCVIFRAADKYTDVGETKVDALAIVEGLTPNGPKQLPLKLENDIAGGKIWQGVSLRLIEKTEFSRLVSEGSILAAHTFYNSKVIYDDCFLKKQKAIFERKLRVWGANKPIELVRELQKLAIDT